jgi:hypothetical protein
VGITINDEKLISFQKCNASNLLNVSAPGLEVMAVEKYSTRLLNALA